MFLCSPQATYTRNRGKNTTGVSSRKQTHQKIRPARKKGDLLHSVAHRNFWSGKSEKTKPFVKIKLFGQNSETKAFGVHWRQKMNLLMRINAHAFDRTSPGIRLCDAHRCAQIRMDVTKSKYLSRANFRRDFLTSYGEHTLTKKQDLLQPALGVVD